MNAMAHTNDDPATHDPMAQEKAGVEVKLAQQLFCTKYY